MKKILVIDDEQRIIDLYLRLFVPEGFVVRFANNAAVATNILIREEIDIIILDLRMPSINGQVLFDVIKEYKPDARVIISSVYPVNEQRKQVANAMDYYDKSDGLLDLLMKVQRSLEKV